MNITPAEDAAAQRLVSVLTPRIDALIRRFESTDFDVADGSCLAGDDKWTQPFHTSHAAWHALAHAIDDLHALQALTVQGEHPNFSVKTYPYAAFPLIRATLEGASVATWLLGPKARPERVTRRLRLLVTDAHNQDEARKLTGHPSNLTGKRSTQADTIIAARGLDAVEAKRKVGMTAIVRDGQPAGRTQTTGLAIWRFLSGVSHSDMWASFALTSNDVLSEAGGVVTANVTTPLTTIADLTMLAISRTELALGLYDDRRTAHIATIG